MGIVSRWKAKRDQKKQLADIKVDYDAPKKEPVYIKIDDVSTSGSGGTSFESKPDAKIYTRTSGGGSSRTSTYAPVKVVKPTPTPTRDTSTRDTTPTPTTPDRPSRVVQPLNNLEEQRKQAERDRILRDFDRQGEERQRRFIEQERERIEKAKKDIFKEGGRESTKILTNEKGEKIEVTTIIIDKLEKGERIKSRVIITKNLVTGKTTTKTFDRGKDRKTRLTGGLIETKPIEKVEEIKIQEVSGRLLQPKKEANLLFGDVTRKLIKEKIEKPFLKTSTTSILFEKDKKEALKEFTKTQLKQISIPSRIISKSEEGLQQAITDLGFKKTKIVPEAKFNLVIEQFGTQQRDILTGKDIPFFKKEEIIIPEHERKTAITFLPQAVRTATYFVPIAGQVLFASDIARSTSKVVEPQQELEFLKLQDTPEIREQIKQSGRRELIFEAAILATAGTIRGKGAVKRTDILRAEKELQELGRQPIRYVEVTKKPSGTVQFEGYQDYKKLQRKIDIVGDLKKTEKGFEFLPEATGTATTTGKFKGVLGNKNLVQIQKFETGVRGGSRKVEQLGDLILYENLGVSTYIPKGQITSIAKVKKGDVSLGGDIIKDISTSQTIKKGDVGLTVGKDSLGLNILIKEKPKIKEIGAKGKGQKSSDEFFENLYRKGEVILEKPKPIQEPPKIDVERIHEGLSKVELIKPKPTLETPTTSIWAGTGLYERTKSIGVAPVLLNTQVQPVLEFKPEVQPIQSQILIQEPQLDIKTKTETRTIRRFQEPKLKDKLISDTIQKPIQKEIIKQEKIQRPLLRLLQRPIQKQIPRQTQIPILKTQLKIPVVQKVSIPKSSTPAKDIIKSMNGKFSIFTKKSGVDVEIGKAKTKEEAEELLKKRLKGTLRASGFVTKDGRKVKLDVEEGFRRGKRDIFRLVEKKEKRIKRKGKSKEAEEIQFFRGKARGRKNGFF